MGLILGAFGRVGRSEWNGALRELAVSAPASCQAWQSDDGLVQLAATERGGTPVPAMARSDAVAAVAIGWIETAGASRHPADVVVDSYERAGATGLATLRGEFTYALWDRRDRSLHVGCDAVALEAPAFSWDGDTFLVSTRALALLRFPSVRRAWDDAYLIHAASGLWNRTASATAFQGIRRMMPGESIRVTRGRLEQLRTHALFSGSRPRGLHPVTAARDLGARIDEVVRSRLRPGRHACVALSGGLDSATIAAAPAWRGMPLQAFSLEWTAESHASDPSLLALDRAIVGLERHSVPVSGDALALFDSNPLADDAPANAPAFQPARRTLLRAARERGFDAVFDGEGGDELFDMAWRLDDLAREGAWGVFLPHLTSRSVLLRLARDAASSGALGPLSQAWFRRALGRARALRPWLRPAFWNGHSFKAVLDETMSYARLRTARERLPQILGAHGRYRRAQSLYRLSLGLDGVSPLLDRRVVEFVASLPARIALDPRSAKGLLRHTAELWLPHAIAWRPKREPLYDWLVRRALGNNDYVARSIEQIEKCAALREFINLDEVRAAVVRVQSFPEGSASLARSLTAFFAVVNWTTDVSLQYGI